MSDEQKKDDLSSSSTSNNNFNHDIEVKQSETLSDSANRVPKFNPNQNMNINQQMSKPDSLHNGQSFSQDKKPTYNQTYPGQTPFAQAPQGQPAQPNQQQPIVQPNQPGYNQPLHGQPPYSQAPQGQPIYGQPPFQNQYHSGVNGQQQPPYQQPFYGQNQYANPPQGQYQGQFAPPVYAGKKTNTKSIVTLILGILSIMVPYLGFLIGIVAIILGTISLKEIKRTNEDGRGLSIAGIITGAVGTLLYGIIILIVILAIVFVGTSGNYYY